MTEGPPPTTGGHLVGPATCPALVVARPRTAENRRSVRNRDGPGQPRPARAPPSPARFAHVAGPNTVDVGRWDDHRVPRPGRPPAPAGRQISTGGGATGALESASFGEGGDWLAGGRAPPRRRPAGQAQRTAARLRRYRRTGASPARARTPLVPGSSPEVPPVGCGQDCRHCDASHEPHRGGPAVPAAGAQAGPAAAPRSAASAAAKNRLSQRQVRRPTAGSTMGQPGGPRRTCGLRRCGRRGKRGRWSQPGLAETWPGSAGRSTGSAAQTTMKGPPDDLALRDRAGRRLGPACARASRRRRNGCRPSHHRRPGLTVTAEVRQGRRGPRVQVGLARPA